MPSASAEWPLLCYPFYVMGYSGDRRPQNSSGATWSSNSMALTEMGRGGAGNALGWLTGPFGPVLAYCRPGLLRIRRSVPVRPRGSCNYP